MASSRIPSRVVPAAVWLLSGLYVWTTLDRGWVPHDEGQLGQAALRILQGELPHRDFDEMYTGGLSYLHALAFHVIGENSGSMRLLLLVHFLATLPVVYYLVSRWYSTAVAAAFMVFVAVWTLPNYPGPVPSWHNLFLSILGTGAVVRFLERNDRRWLLLAGVAGGLSILFKQVGVYYVAAVALFLVQHAVTRPVAGPPSGSRRWAWLVVAGAMVAPLAAVTMLIQSAGLGAGAYVVVLLPCAAVTLLAIRLSLAGGTGATRTSVSSLVRLAAPFTAGVMMPVVAYVGWFAWNDSVAALVHGAIEVPQQRLQGAAYPFVPFHSLLIAPGAALAVAAMVPGRLLAGHRAATALSAALIVWLVFSGPVSSLYQAAWHSALLMLPVGVIGAVLAVGWGTVRVSDPRTQQVILIACVSAFCSVSLIPFGAAIYFCYVAPLAALATGGAFWIRGRTGHPLAGLLLAFFVLFALFRLNPGFIYAMGRQYAPYDIGTQLPSPRAAGVAVHADEAAIYGDVLALVRTHAGNARIYAFPDCPEVYYLSGHANPTRRIYEFLADPPVTDDAHLEVARQRDVRVLVVNTFPAFSTAPSGHLLEELAILFPESRRVGHFLVRWRP